jgi:hypothetical protein
LFSAASLAADSWASWAAVSFDLKAPELGDGDAAARKLVGVPLPAADAATTPTKTMAAATADAISNVRALLISRMVRCEPQGRLGIGCEF